MVFPVPGPPQTNTDELFGNPPSINSSNPGMDVWDRLLFDVDVCFLGVFFVGAFFVDALFRVIGNSPIFSFLELIGLAILAF